MGKIFYLMGKSASGKDTIFKKIMEDERICLKNIVMYTTRPIRSGEVNGIDYYFVTEEEAAQLEQQGQIIEMRQYSTVYGIWKYFTVSDEQIDLQEHSYLMIGTLESYRKTKDYFGEEHLVPLYVTVPDGIRLERALEREKRQPVPKYAEMCRRFLADEEDFKEENLKACHIMEKFENIAVEQCVERLVQRILRDI